MSECEAEGAGVSECEAEGAGVSGCEGGGGVSQCEAEGAGASDGCDGEGGASVSACDGKYALPTSTHTLTLPPRVRLLVLWCQRVESQEPYLQSGVSCSIAT